TMPVEAFLKVMDRLPEPSLLVSGDGAVLGANRALARLGVRPSGLTGRSLADLMVQPPEAVAEYIRRCARSGQPLPASLTILDDEGGRSIPCRAEGSLLNPRAGDQPAVVLIRLIPRDDSVSQFLRLNRQIA